MEWVTMYIPWMSHLLYHPCILCCDVEMWSECPWTLLDSYINETLSYYRHTGMVYEYLWHSCPYLNDNASFGQSKNGWPDKLSDPWTALFRAY